MHDEAEAQTEPVEVTPDEVSEAGNPQAPEPTTTEPAPAEQPQSQAEETSLPVDEVFAWHREKEAALSSWEETPGEATEPENPEPGFEPVGEPEEEAESGGEGEGEPVETADGDPDREPEAGDGNRLFRLRPQNALDERAFELFKESLTLEDALAQARAEQGVSEGETPTETGSGGEGDEAPLESDPAGDGHDGLGFLSAAELAGEITRQRAENLEVLKQNLDVSVYAEGENRIFQLEQAHEAAVRREAAEAEATANAQRQQLESRTAALEKYPDLQDGESRFAIRHAEVLAAWEAMRDSRAEKGDAPMLVADLVARELGISPVSPSGGEEETSLSPPTHTQPSTPQPPSSAPEAQVSAGRSAATPPRPQSRAAVPRRTQAAAPVVPSSGAQRTQSHQPRVTAALEAVQTPEDYERLKQTFST